MKTKAIIVKHKMEYIELKKNCMNSKMLIMILYVYLKKCIININYVKSFNTSQTGKIVVALIDGTEENVSRRRIRDLLDFLENRSL